ncbi:MAG: P-type conjugative transfer protein TrbL [Endozoicomonas sp. (ex Botrylloides leachii)]|nr:P-type conjugative transfer protein TrbL [Endozoicomonas sp. (ex Botrylloides leachii)]
MKNKIVAFIIIYSFIPSASAAVDQKGIFDHVLSKYQEAASQWGTVIVTHASHLFWSLVIISMVWTFGQMALKKEDIQEFLLEFIRFTIFTGFFWWLLTSATSHNGHIGIVDSIYISMQNLAGQATHLGSELHPSGIIDIGFSIFNKVLDQTSIWSPVDSTAGIFIGLAVLLVLAIISVNMLILLCSGWVLAYAGVFFLGFGGSRWTSDIAISYYKTVLGLAAQLFSMVLIIGIGKTFLDDYYHQMTQGLTLKDLAVMLIVSVVLYMITDRVPSLISGIITGASVGNMGVSGAAAAAGAAAGAAAAVTMGSSMMKESTSQIIGGAKALGAAVDMAKQNVSTGEDVASKLGFRTNPNSSGGAGVARTAVDAGANLAKAGGQTASELLLSKLDAMKKQADGSVGGKMASSIKNKP